jgi:excisionase family DNA binding protein
MAATIKMIDEKLNQVIVLLGKLVSQGHANPRRLMRLKEAASYISVSPWKLRGLVQSGEIPVVKNNDGAGGGVWLLDVRDLDAWVSRRKVTF